MIAAARDAKCIPKARKVTSKSGLRINGFTPTDHSGICRAVVCWFHAFACQSCNATLCSRNDIWWSFTEVALSIFVPAVFGEVTVMLECDFSWCLVTQRHFSWQAQYLVKLNVGEVHRMLQCHLSWQAQNLVKLHCHFSWQAQTSPHVNSQPTALLHPISEPTTWHHTAPHHSTSQHITSPPPTHQENTTSHHQTPLRDGRAEGWCAQKTWFGYRTGWWPCARSIGKLFLWLINFSPWNFRPWLA